MRQIEYRAWDRTAQRMTGWHDPVPLGRGIDLRQYVLNGSPLRGPLPDGLIPLEFTQATDRTGVKIFEGDTVLDGNGLKFKVEYRGELCRFVLCSLNGRNVVRSNLEAGMNIEVIGHIYEAMP